MECGVPLPHTCSACGNVMLATAKFCAQCGAEADQVGELTSLPSSSTPRGAPVVSAERRQLTVMFVDLVGSTALAAQLDPEDLREVIGKYQMSVATTVAHDGGFVAKYLGDGVLAYFDYPQALAEPNGVVIGPATRRLIGDLFECRALGAVALKGFADRSKCGRCCARAPSRAVSRRCVRGA
jgi:class 3 adenylate cyclase